MKTLYCGIPDKLLVKWLKGKKYIAPADEGEAIAIAAGYYMATKKRATVFMSADGFLNALNPITSLVIPYDIKMNIVISCGRQERQHKIASDILGDLLNLIRYDSKKLHFKIVQK